jgi:hypothetical protein
MSPAVLDEFNQAKPSFSIQLQLVYSFKRFKLGAVFRKDVYKSPVCGAVTKAKNTNDRVQVRTPVFK